MTTELYEMSRVKLVSLTLSPRIGRRGFCFEPKAATSEASVADCNLIMEQMNYLQREFSIESKTSPSPGTYKLVYYEISSNGKLNLLFTDEKIEIV